MNDKCILAMYDFRAKQKYIYRTNRIKEIVGASAVIADGFNKLYEIAESVGCIIEHEEENPDFSSENLFCDGAFNGKVVYEGGGNLFVLYDSRESYIKVNKAFSRYLLKDTYSLKMICADLEVDMSSGDRDFVKDRKALYERHAYLENKELFAERTNILPVVQLDRLTSLPLADISTKGGKREKVSQDSKAKLDMYKNSGSLFDFNYSNMLDDYITEKNEESLLAVVYIDGNKIGERVRKVLDGAERNGVVSYTDGVKALRTFSERINSLCIEDGMRGVADKCEELRLAAKIAAEGKGKTWTKDDDMKFFFRPIVGAGDEVTFICNARLAYTLSVEYLNAIHNSANNFSPSDDDGEMTSCAGIAVFHSHAPFADAYRIAEECCDEAKKSCRNYSNTSWLSFQFCQSGIDNSLASIREKEDGMLISRPWMVIDAGDNHFEDKPVVTINHVREMSHKLNSDAVARGNVKSLLQYAADVNGDSYLEQEIRRIIAHSNNPLVKDDYFDISGLTSEQRKKLLFDVILMYDLWFKEASDESC